MKFLKKFRLRRAKLTPDASPENFRRRHASFVFSTYDCKNAVPAAGSWHFSFKDIRRCLQTGDMVSKRLYKHWILHHACFSGMIGAIRRHNIWGIFPEINCLKCVALTRYLLKDNDYHWPPCLLFKYDCSFSSRPPSLSTADEHIIWKTLKSVIIPSICPIVARGFIKP